MDRRAFVRTMRTLEPRYPMEDWARGMGPFEILISTVLSQSTTASNERLALAGLRERFDEITPEHLAGARSEDIARAIWRAGLARQRAPRIQAIARTVLDEYGGRLDAILGLSTEAARRSLTALPGIGPKTADVVLSMAGGHLTFPVDTHIARIARRWRLVGRTGYEGTRDALERWTPPNKRKVWHLAMIAHGRTLCKARNPRCEECPVRRSCDWYRDRKRRLTGAAARGRARATKG